MGSSLAVCPNQLAIFFYKFPILLAALTALSLLVLVKTAARCRRLSSAGSNPPPALGRKVNLYTLLFSFLASMLAVELIFATWFVQSDNAFYSLAGRTWLRRYWHPTNSQGYRDFSWDGLESGSSKLLVVVGDSFMAGAGIERIEDRFANILAVELGPTWTSRIVAKPGWSTAEQTEALRRIAVKPDLIVLSYMINDIQSVGVKLKAIPDQLYYLPPRFGLWFIDNSYFLNFLYWRMNAHMESRVMEGYWSSIIGLFDNPAVWTEHRRELADLVAVAQSKSRKTMAVVFPHMLEVERSVPATARVVQLFNDLGVQGLDLAPLLAGRDPKSLIVNRMDSHPNESVHREVAEHMASFIKSNW